MIKNFTLITLSSLLLVFSSSCKKELTDSSNQGGTSSYTFDGTPGGCATPVVAGFYSVGKPMDNTNTLTFTVNVIRKGSYNLRTTPSNGVYFAASGAFTNSGPQTIVFYGIGTPIKAGNFPYVPVTNNTCNFILTFLSGPPSAVFTYAGGTGNCTAPVISGMYGSGVALGSGNYVDLGVNVTTPGAYTVSTNSANGISFSGSGAFTANGAQVIRLIGNGTPVSPASNAYTPSNNGCSFTINVTNAGGTSIYTLNGAPGACVTPVVSGVYMAGVPLGAGNTITVTANVTTAGTYTLSTTTANGITFSGSGTLAVGPAQPITLTGSGTPTAAIVSNFTIGVNGCTFPITTVAPPVGVYTLTCNSTAVNGSYVTGTALTASNTVDVEVNVTTAGSYTITSNTVNGMTFSKTGVFAGTGIQNVTLTGSGTPVSAGTNPFTVGAAACPFSVIVTAPTSPCSGLVDGKFVMTGQFTLNGFSFGLAFNGQFQVTIQQSPVQLDVFFPGTTPPAPGIYSIGTVTMHCLAANFTDWNATSGMVYVSTDINGNTVVEFCNVNFKGTVFLPPGGTITSTGAGKMVF